MQNRPDENIVTLRVGPLVHLPSVVRSLGADPALIFRQAGFELDEFSDPDHRIAYLPGSRLLAHCVEATGCETLGFQLGQRANPSHLGLSGFLLRAAPTVRQALQAFVENLDLHDEAGTASLVIGPEYSSLSFSIELPGVAAIEQISDLAAVIMYKIMQVLCGPEWAATSVKLQRRTPPDPAPYRRYFRTAMFYNSTESGITFRSQWLDRRLPTSDNLLFQHLQQEALHLHNLQHHELMEELPGVLKRGLLTDKFAAQDIADRFGIHERTLHRRLQLAGTSFRHELDRARESVSEQLLVSTSLPICDIANALGYADSSGFIRAFERWTGLSPTSWRKRNHAHLQNGP